MPGSLLPPHPGDLSDRELSLLHRETTPGDPARGWVPSWHFTIAVARTREPVGMLSLRLGHSEWIERYAGHVGFAVAEPRRGHRYAARALKLVAPLAWRSGLAPLWITCNPDNVASRRTCQIAGAEWIEIVAAPAGNDMFARGERFKCRYRLDPPER